MSSPIDATILARKTQKVLGDPEKPWTVEESDSEWAGTLMELLNLAAHAPYHYPSHEVHRMDKKTASVFPWRMYVLSSTSCRALLKEFKQREIKGGKVTKMLATARALIQVTWLPDPGTLANEELFQGNKRNMEHIAATAAAIQNLLLGATARNIPTYWSSGGKLRNPEIAELLGIPDTEIPLGSLFLFPTDLTGAEIKTGSLRGKGGTLEDWSTWVELG